MIDFKQVYENQTLIKTKTGIWQVVYNAENRPITFTQGTTVISCKYDSMGRRFEKKVIENGTTVLWERYVYDSGYLQIAAFDVIETAGVKNYTLKHTLFWDASEAFATRPLAISIANVCTYFYTHDLTKNVCELIDTDLNISQTYDYSPFGEVSVGIPAGGSLIANPFRFSSEFHDSELGLVYYNYRHYNPTDGRWLSRDPIAEQGGLNLYGFIGNNIFINDILGCFEDGRGSSIKTYNGKVGVPIAIFESDYEFSPGIQSPIGENGIQWPIYFFEKKIYYILADYELTVDLGPKGHKDFSRFSDDKENVCAGFDWTLEDHSFGSHPFNLIAGLWGEGIKAYFMSKDEIAGDKLSDREFYNSGSLIGESIKKCDKDKFQRMMHRYQDTFVHYEKGYRAITVGHAGASIYAWITSGKSPDDSEKMWNNAERSTIAFLNEWDKNCCCVNNKWMERK